MPSIPLTTSLTPLLPYLTLALGSYLLGSVPVGVLVSKATLGVDLRQYGSGRTGATNALRVLGPRGSAVVFLGDFAKGLVPVWVAGQFLQSDMASVIAGLGAIAGHNWSVFLGFQGGRGVSTGLGALVTMEPRAAIVTAVVGIVVVVVSRYVSLGSLAGTIAGALALTWLVLSGVRAPTYLTYAVVAALMVIFQHRDNIQRLLAGTERRLGERSSPPGGAPGRG
ncbi:MAG: glycerol-3-phosphate 1-O-acyltransferase PlsY [Chloroflexi bacterium]|nr:glycerol-3-phosphate 1-O-acyltransferase PlsY [Chloroflexota bacterium]